MKILAIMGSPHKGNTLELTQRFELKLKALGDVDFEYVHLKDANIKPCRGCFGCFVRGEDKCPIKDDEKPEIERKMKEADGVVFVSPVYSMHVSYLFKQFLDRFAYNGHRPRYFDKYAVVLSATGGMGLDETLKYMKMWISAWGFNVVGQLGYIASPKNTAYRPLIVRKDTTDEVARDFFQAIKEKRPRKCGFGDHMGFRMVQGVCSRLKEMSPADYAYVEEKGWFDPKCKYFTENAVLSPLWDMAARALAWNAVRGIDKQMTKQGIK